MRLHLGHRRLYGFDQARLPRSPSQSAHVGVVVRARSATEVLATPYSGGSGNGTDNMCRYGARVVVEDLQGDERGGQHPPAAVVAHPQPGVAQPSRHGRAPLDGVHRGDHPGHPGLPVLVHFERLLHQTADS